MSEKTKLVTHSGHFHADDIFAIATLQILLGEENTVVLRSREKEIIQSGDYVVDVGGVYDPETKRFDHHQEGGAGERDNTVPYASFGLVWKEFGEKICGNKDVAEKIDQKLIQWIDATDNGVQIIETKIKDVYPYDIGLYLNTFTPSWNEEADVDQSFMKAVEIAKNLLKREIEKRKNLIEAGERVEEIYRKTIDKRIITMDRYYPSNNVLAKYPEPLFVVSPKEDGTWFVRGVREDENLFIWRKKFPEKWGGKMGEDLVKVTQIPGSIFCHRDRFIAVNKTKEGAIKMAQIALELD